jgi:hypothetical protein
MWSKLIITFGYRMVRLQMVLIKGFACLDNNEEEMSHTKRDIKKEAPIKHFHSGLLIKLRKER